MADGIVRLVEPGSLESAIAAYSATNQQHGTVQQPSLFAEGSSWETVQVYKLIVTKTVHYEFFTNFKVALGCLFQVLWALYSPYPKESQNVWLVLQRLVFEVESEHDCLEGVVAQVLHELK